MSRLIVRQMFSRVKVLDVGDTELLTGDVVEKRKMLQANIDAKNAGKTEATYEQLIMWYRQGVADHRVVPLVLRSKK